MSNGQSHGNEIVQFDPAVQVASLVPNVVYTLHLRTKTAI